MAGTLIPAPLEALGDFAVAGTDQIAGAPQQPASTAARNAMPFRLRRVGMLATVGNQTYRLLSVGTNGVDLTDADWEVITKAQDDGLAALESTVATLALTASIEYPNVAAGLAATSDGDYFVVRETGDNYSSRYLNDGGTAVLDNSLPSKSALENLNADQIGDGTEKVSMTIGERQEIVDLRQTLPNFDRESASLIPIFRDDPGNVPVYLENGGLSFSFLGEQGKKAVANYLDPLGVIPYQIDSDIDVIPIFRDDPGNIPLWLENGGLACSFLSKSLIAQINAQVQGRQYGFGRKVPVATDGRSLFRYRSKVARLKGGEVIRPTVLLVGDSYMELPALPQAIANSLYSAHAKAADGWLSAHNPNSINAITRTTVGAWTNYDASDGVAPANGCGVDGKSTSTTGTDKREIFYNIKCTEFTVYYYDGSGAINFIRYAADGATVEATTALVFGGTNTFKSYTFAGQPDELRNYEVNTAINTGTVVIHGYRATRNSAAGIIVDKCGNAGATSDNLTLFSGQLANFQAIQPDLIMMAVGTNNASVKSTTVQFESDVPALIDAYRALWPNVGIVLVAQPLCTGAKQSPLIDYRDAAYEIALAKNCEFYSMFDDWADFSTMDGLGMFLADGIHPSTSGSIFTSRRLTQIWGL